MAKENKHEYIWKFWRLTGLSTLLFGKEEISWKEIKK